MTKEQVTTTLLTEKKEQGKKITMLTAYDYPTAKLIDEAEIDIILVGDSLGMVVLGYEDTLQVTVEDMIHHAQAVTRAASRSLVVVDMPFMSYKISQIAKTVENAGRIIKESRAQAVKVEGGQEVVAEIKAIIKAGIPVMGHLGLTPQAINQLGGFKVQGKEEEAARELIEDAKALEAAGVFAIVLECIPSEVAQRITAEVKVPTIGIGAGKDCDGQVLVNQDLLGIYDKFTPKFVRKYANLNQEISAALKKFKEDVEQGDFPSPEESF
ncbi:3-methyl-2-oxobutanoate hydroxymethyltransferase [Fuchsiella alkaliacetigena]|uniref:3-methyl-2-oxobutanoate hydroxymethyltransferase n=1 Tax=Fuchsiella alkaliacetigena TaxID=957042 RepID=UPI00200A9099|nr:3-methyl-2-oxobutanoate hydroxymethyltransferase [Fuchsiella alkaliacetigena]MCK8824894.1 3-methyl-2-oxobutanoate hydroxymethyltransferase [Fuchsiella alkaliacetigena]